MADGVAYQSVPPPSGSSEASSAFADALKRAKEIAARMGTAPPASEGPSNVPYQETAADQARKRGHPDEGDEPQPKKLLPEGGMPLMDGKDPKSIALQVAASIAQRAGLGSMLTEELKIPNKFVGLVIGRGGEQINKLQSETGARIQVAPDPPMGVIPPPDRAVTISGSTQAVDKAKALLHKICDEGKIPDSLMSVPVVAPGETVCEMMIPASKVGLIIGKGGETIKSLQERAQCRMVMIQDGPYSNAPEKPLRIMGDPTRCQRGKDLVTDLLTEKELESRQRGGPPPKGPPPNMPGVKTVEAPVPGNKCGLIIGKGGETIRQIIQQSGAHVELNRNVPESSPTKYFMIRGTDAQIQQAQNLIREKIEDQQRGGPGRGRGGGGGNFGDRKWNQNQNSNWNQQQQQQQQQQHQQQQSWSGGGGGGGGGNNYPYGNQQQYGQQEYSQQQYGQQQQYTQPGQQVAQQGQQAGQGGQQDYAAAWAAYYQQYYQQQAAAAAAAGQTPGQQQQAGGQPDYTAAWNQYFKAQQNYYQYPYQQGQQPGQPGQQQQQQQPQQQQQGGQGGQPPSSQ